MQQLSKMRRFNLTDILSSTILGYIAFLFFVSPSFPFALHWNLGKMRIWILYQPWLGGFGMLFLFLAVITLLWKDED